jgi:hypothetical protein
VIIAAAVQDGMHHYGVFTQQGKEDLVGESVRQNPPEGAPPINDRESKGIFEHPGQGSIDLIK